MRARTKRSAIDELYAQFIQYGITKAPTYLQYINIVGIDNSPITRRHIKKFFYGRWVRVLNTLEKAHPNVYEEAKKAHTPVVEEKPSIKEKLAKAKKDLGDE